MAGPMSGNAATSAGKTKSPVVISMPRSSNSTDYAPVTRQPAVARRLRPERIVIHTAFTGYPDEPREICIAQLVEPEAWQPRGCSPTRKTPPGKIHRCHHRPPPVSSAQLAAAMRCSGAFAENCGQKVAHFLVQCLFCMFAEDEALLPLGIFTDLLKMPVTTPTKPPAVSKNCSPPYKENGEYGDHDITWFNGGLFNTIQNPTLTVTDLQALHRAAADMDCAPSTTIFGTPVLSAASTPPPRAPAWCHYTDTGTIQTHRPTHCAEPLAAEWQTTRANRRTRPKFGMVKGHKKNEYRPTMPCKTATPAAGFQPLLNAFRVAGPCGSGNFYTSPSKPCATSEKRAHIDA